MWIITWSAKKRLTNSSLVAHLLLRILSTSGAKGVTGRRLCGIDCASNVSKKTSCTRNNCQLLCEGLSLSLSRFRSFLVWIIYRKQRWPMQFTVIHFLSFVLQRCSFQCSCNHRNKKDHTPFKSSTAHSTRSQLFVRLFCSISLMKKSELFFRNRFKCQ